MNAAEGEQAEKAFNAIFINGHQNGSLMVRMARNEEQLATMNGTLEMIQADVKATKTTMDEFPGRLMRNLVLFLTFVTLLIGLIVFLGPSIRKSMGMSAYAPMTTAATDAALPETVETRGK